MKVAVIGAGGMGSRIARLLVSSHGPLIGKTSGEGAGRHRMLRRSQPVTRTERRRKRWKRRRSLMSIGRSRARRTP